jgi:hypothetical protein
MLETPRQTSTNRFDSISLDDDSPDKPTTSSEEHRGADEYTTCAPDPPTHQPDTEGDVSGGEDARPNTLHSPQIHTVVIDVSQAYPVPIEIHSVSEGAAPASPQHASLVRHSEDDCLSSASAVASTSRAKSTSDLPLPPLSAPPSSSGRSSTSHKPSRSHGPSIFEQVVSKTRPSFLPPKKKEEDIKHLHDWEQMMKRSRAAGASLTRSFLSAADPRYQRRKGARPCRSAG